MIFLSANNASTVSVDEIDASTTEIVVAAGTGDIFPNPGDNEYFVVTLGVVPLTEIIWVTERTGDVFTIERGKEGTSAQVWPADTFVRQLVTEGQLQALVQKEVFDATVADLVTKEVFDATVLDLEEQIETGVNSAVASAHNAEVAAASAASEASVASAAAEQAEQDAEAAKIAAEIALAAVGASSLSNVVINTTPVYIEGIGYCAYIIIDQTNKPISVVDVAGVTWVLENGFFTALPTSGGSGGDNSILQTVSVELPNVGYASIIFIDRDNKPFAAYGGDGSSWSLVNGVLTQTGTGSGTGVEAYYPGASFTDIYGNLQRNWMFADQDIIIMIIVVGQSLAIGSNPDHGASFQGSISGLILVLEGTVTGQIVLRQGISGTGVLLNTVITGYNTFTVGVVQTVASTTLTTPSGSFQGSISGSVLSIEGPVTGNICPGQIVTGAGVAANTRLGNPLSYTVNNFQTVASTTISVAWDTARSTTPTYPNNVLMFGLTGETYGRVRPAGAPVDRFVPCVEADVGGGDVESGYIKESVCTTMGNTIYADLQARGLDATILMTIAGSGGTPYTGMTRGTTNNDEADRLVQAAVEIAAAQNKKIIVIEQHAIEGEADNANGVQAYPYARQMVQWQSHGSTDFKAITGQAEPVRMTLSQCNRRADNSAANSRTPYGALLAMKLSPMLCCVGPIYDVLADSSQTHPYSYGYMKMGTRAGHAAAAEILGIGYQPLEAIRCYFASTTEIRIQYNRAVTVDKSNSIINGTFDNVDASCGFTFRDGTVSPPTISGVASVSSDTIAITLSGAPALFDVRLIYASYTSTAAMGYKFGPRGFIRATASWGNVVDGNSLDNQSPLYDWACTQTITPGMTVAG